MDYLLSIIDVKLRIIDKTKNGGSKLGMNIILLLRDNICPLHALNYGQKSNPGLGGGPFIGERFYGMGLVGRLGGNTIRGTGAGDKLSICNVHARVAGSRATHEQKGKTDSKKSFHHNAFSFPFLYARHNGDCYMPLFITIWKDMLIRARVNREACKPFPDR
jgi:hypothetical protein